MVKRAVLASLVALLAACGGEKQTETISTQNTNDTRVAKEVFGYIPAGSNQRAEAVGGYARGCQAGAVQLPETGPTWQACLLYTSDAADD